MVFQVLLLLLATWSSLLARPAVAQSCVSIATSSLSYCQSFISYPVYVPASANIVYLDALFNSTGLPSFLQLPFSDACRTASLQFACAAVYHNCTFGNPNSQIPTGSEPVCKKDCNNFLSVCNADVSSFVQAANTAQTEAVAAQLLSLLPNCSGTDATTQQPYATSNCVDLTVVAGNLTQSVCPSPLIENPYPGTNHSTCLDACCVPCVPTSYFYPPGYIDQVDQTALALGIISFFCTLFIVISYIVLPHKRGFPSDIILNMAIALTIFHGTVLMNLGPHGRNLVRCENLVDMAMPGTTNPATNAQGAIAIYGILGAVLWYGFLVFNIFMSVVYLNTNLRDYRIHYTIVLWALPWINTIVALAVHQIGYLGLDTYVLVENGIVLDGILMIPFALVIFPSVILNVLTLARIASVAMRRNATYTQMIRLQLRPFLFVLAIFMVFLIYWIHYELQLRNSPSQEFVAPWFTCILEGYGQDFCARTYSMPSLPNYNSYFFAEVVVNCLGMIIFMFFGARRDVFLGWYVLITEGSDANFFSINNSTSNSRLTSAQSRESVKSSTKEEKKMEEYLDTKKGPTVSRESDF